MPIFADRWKSPADANMRIDEEWAPLLPPEVRKLLSSTWSIDTLLGGIDGAIWITDLGFDGTEVSVLVSGGTRYLGTRLLSTVTYANPDGSTATKQRGLWVRVIGDL